MADDVPDEEKLDELEAHIQKARADAEEAVDAFADEPKETFIDGDNDDGDDDQTIAPPG